MRRAGSIPLVLAGDGAAALGVVAGTGARRLLWLDARPRAGSPAGDLVELPLAALLGWDLPGLVRRPLREAAVMLCGARNPDPAGAGAPDGSAIARDDPSWLSRSSGPLAVHWDLELGDPAPAPAGGRRRPDGRDGARAAGWLRAAAATGQLAAVTLAGYDPVADEDGSRLALALGVLRAALGRSDATGRQEAAGDGAGGAAGERAPADGRTRRPADAVACRRGGPGDGP